MLGDAVPLHYYKPQGNHVDPTPILLSISDHRELNDGNIEFLVQWGYASEETETWVSMDELISRRDFTFHDYFAACGITSIPVRALGMSSTLNLSA